LSNDSESRIWNGQRQTPKCSARWTESVQRRIRDFFMLTMVAHIFCAHRRVPTHRLLYFQVPLVIAWNLDFARIKEIEGGNRSAVHKIRTESSVGRDRLAVQVPRRCG